ncbi:hypothetical protein ACFRAO_23950 [Streptomyces sp. NPDC056656]|uniref:hypothetical protein n=1 Tax=Streptomyces sp. NPDC056656 TaxID=3345895 RepID=UPI003693E042
MRSAAGEGPPHGQTYEGGGQGGGNSLEQRVAEALRPIIQAELRGAAAPAGTAKDSTSDPRTGPGAGAKGKPAGPPPADA